MSQLIIRAHDHDGNPLPETALASLYLTDLNRNPCRQPYGPAAPGRAVIEHAAEPFVIVMTCPVEGYGTISLFADNEGRGYRRQGEIDLQTEFARSRLHAVRTRLATAELAGLSRPAQVATRLDKAAAALQAATAPGISKSKAARLTEEALREALWAGDELVLEIARHAIAQRGPRKGFLFGCNVLSFHRGRPFTDRFESIFNAATVPFYRGPFEREEGKPDYSDADGIAAWLVKAGITAKGHPLTYFHEVGIPKWMRAKSFDENLASARARCQTIARRYAGRIDRWDVINEGHDWANELGYTSEQMLELTRVSCAGARAGNPAAQTVVNCCAIFGEYGATGKTYLGPRAFLRTPYQYLRACLDGGMDFDVVGLQFGLQLYQPGYDLFEIDRMLDWYATLGKPLHLTELCVYRTLGKPEYVEHPDWWHAPWTEPLLAEWLAQFYALCYSKPAVEAVSWWDLADTTRYWPGHCTDFTTNETYRSLKAIIGSLRA